MNSFISGLAGLISGVLSSWGLGGGTLLIIYMTAIAKIEQRPAQGINLLYFIPTSAAALVSHVKNRLIVKSAVIPAIITGVPATLIAAYFVSGIDSSIMKKVFGGFLIVNGVLEFFRKSEKARNEQRQ